jgi:RNA polymerase-binding protein DksA
MEDQRQKLIEMGRRIEEEFNRRAEAINEEVATPGELSHLPTHPADQDAEGVEVEVAVGQTHDQLLESIRAALERIDQGTYGTCETCGQAIAQQRLRALPYAVRCVDCQREEAE